MVRVLVHLFFTFYLAFDWWPLAFLILSPPLQNVHVVLQTKKMSPFFYLSLQISVALFLVELRWPAAYFLFFSVFLLLYISKGNLSKLNTLDNTDTETISAFRFRLYGLFSCLCFTRRRWLCDFPPK